MVELLQANGSITTVNTNQIGTYFVTYNVVDHAGNKAQQVVRTVKVQNPEPPLTA